MKHISTYIVCLLQKLESFIEKFVVEKLKIVVEIE